jgi:hypothetical protein
VHHFHLPSQKRFQLREKTAVFAVQNLFVRVVLSPDLKEKIFS